MSADKKIPHMTRYDEIAEFWDSRSLADYWDETEPAEFEIEPTARRRYLVAVDPGLLKRAKKVAFMRGLTTEGLINLLLEQRLHQVESGAVQ